MKELDKDVSTNEELGQFLKEIDNTRFSRIKSNTLNDESWVLADTVKTSLLMKLDKNPEKARDVFFKIFQGIPTGLDIVFVLELVKENQNVLQCFSKSLNKEILIEKEFVKPFLMGKDVKRYERPYLKNWIIFPYTINENKPSLLEEKDLRTQFPLGWRYLEENRDLLIKREDGRFSERWWQYSRPQNLLEFEKPKILTPEIANKGEMTIDENGYYYHTTKVYSLSLKPNLPESITYFLGVLNSKMLFFFLSATGYVLRGGYFTFKTDYLNPFPIRRIDFNKELDVFLYEQVLKLVTNIIHLKSEKKDTSLFENKIDELVFHLYGLTEQ